MPCTSGPTMEQEIAYERERRLPPAMLCAILTVLENVTVGHLAIDVDDNERMAKSAVLDLVDWEEAGVSRREFHTWWREHKAKDEQRRAEEKAERERKRLKKSALAKLTPAEKKALRLR